MQDTVSSTASLSGRPRIVSPLAAGSFFPSSGTPRTCIQWARRSVRCVKVGHTHVDAVAQLAGIAFRLFLGGGELPRESEWISLVHPHSGSGCAPGAKTAPSSWNLFFSSFLLSSPHTPCPVRSTKYPSTFVPSSSHGQSLATCSCGLVSCSPVSHSYPFRKGSCSMQLDFPCDSTPRWSTPPLWIFGLSPGSVDLRRPGSSSSVRPPTGYKTPLPATSTSLSFLSLLWITRVVPFTVYPS